MEPSYTEWTYVLTDRKYRIYKHCPYCDKNCAYTMMRYYTNRDGETERQYRVECPICKHKGKTYLHQNIAEQSWEVRENDPETISPWPGNKRKRLFYESLSKGDYN